MRRYAHSALKGRWQGGKGEKRAGIACVIGGFGSGSEVVARGHGFCLAKGMRSDALVMILKWFVGPVAMRGNFLERGNVLLFQARLVSYEETILG